MNITERIKSQFKQITASAFVRRFFGVFALDVVAKGSMFIFLPVFLRLMTKEEFGAFSYLLFVIMNMAYIIKAGLDTAQAKLYFDFRGTKRRMMLFNVNMIALALFVLVIVALQIGGLEQKLFHKIGVDNAVFSHSKVYIYLYVFSFIQQVMLQAYLIAANKPAKFQIYNLFKVLGMSVGSVLVLYFLKEAKVKNRLMVESLVSIVVFMPLTIYFIGQMKAVFNWEIIRKALKIGFPMLGSVFVGIVYSFVDKYYLQRNFGFEKVAVYSLAVFLTTPVNLIFSSFNLLWYSKFFREKDVQKSYRQTKKVYAIMLATFAAIFILLWACVFICVRMDIIEKSYLPVVYILPIVFFYRVLESLSNLYSNFLIQGERTIMIFAVTVSVSIVTWVLFALTIPVYGYYAAATVLFSMELLRTLILILLARKQVFGKLRMSPVIQETGGAS